MAIMLGTGSLRTHALMVATGVLLALSSVRGDAPAVPAATEGDDGVFEGQGEGAIVFEGVAVADGAVPSPDEGADGVLEGNGEGAVPVEDDVVDYSGFSDFYAPFPEALPPPPPGPPGMCGDLGEACCMDEMCSPGTACNSYDIYQAGTDYYPDAFTCVECGGFGEYEPDSGPFGPILFGPGPDFRIGQIACDDGAPCEAGLEVYDCDGTRAAECRPCGQAGETCCNVGASPCEAGLQCLDYDVCGVCGTLREPPCPGGTCSEGLVARQPPPSVISFGPSSQTICLPALACGTDPGAECCTDGPACFGTDGFGTPLACVAGACTRCGLRGTVPCDDGCVEGLAPVRGLCRGPDEELCGMSGEACCGADYNVQDYGEQCEEGFSCDYGYDDDPSVAPSPIGFGAGPGFSPFSGTCSPCGALGQIPCGGFLGPNKCDEGLEPDFSFFGPGPPVCKAPCGVEGGAPCMLEGPQPPFAFNCPCKQGLIEVAGVCEAAPVRPSSGSAPTAAAAMPTASMSPPAGSPATRTFRRSMDAPRARTGERRSRNPRGERMERMRRPRGPRGERR